MRNPLTHYVLLAHRWAWVIFLGVALCGGTTYAITKLMRPTYQASALLLVRFTTTGSDYDKTTAALEVLPTYAQLITNPTVLQPVLAQHKNLTLKQLIPMISVKPQSNTQIIELDVTNTDPLLATQLANEISQSLAHYSDTTLPATVDVFQALPPTDPIQPKPALDAALGALVGLGLALALIVAFEWVDDRLTSVEEIQELLGADTLTVIPHLSRSQRVKNAEEIPPLAEGCRILCATINAAQQAQPFKLVMVTSPLAGEGKSTIAANLASFLALSGKRVLLVDADLRHPVLDQHFMLDNHQGLSNAFLEMWAQIQVKLDGQPTEIPSLRVLTAGVLPSNPTELLQSPLAKQLFEHFKQSAFDYVLFDTPPLLPIADAQILASYIEATVLVVDVSKTPRKILARVKQVLRRTPTIVLGVVANKSRWSDYGDIRDYLISLQQERSKSDISLSIPSDIPPDIPFIPDALPAQEMKAQSTFPRLPTPNSMQNELGARLESVRYSSPKMSSPNDIESSTTVPLPHLYKGNSEARR
ncbi:MAG TPA: polysaccharide biosynthesis tyrosine autokinase [Ktedonobacteraceae bacterium]|nr:polysaccharide biosynthesis tyrosine autokinase [Ktedonobacteraceae bacterium]